MPRVTSWYASTLEISSPSKMTLPLRALSRPLIVFSVVVLPAPFEPMRVTISARWTCRLTPLSAWIWP